MRNIVDQADEIIAIAPWSGQNDVNAPKADISEPK
jgi:hypothetical protein